MTQKLVRRRTVGGGQSVSETCALVLGVLCLPFGWEGSEACLKKRPQVTVNWLGCGTRVEGEEGRRGGDKLLSLVVES